MKTGFMLSPFFYICIKMKMKKNYPTILFWAFWTLVLFSCTLEKRRYFKGYYIGKRHHSESVKVNSNVEKNSFYSLKGKEYYLNTIQSNENIITSDKSNNENQNDKNQYFIKSKKNYILNDTCKDELIFKNGERLKVKIVEITPYVVRFYNCSLGSPYLSEIPKNDLSVILPHEGKAEFLDNKPSNQTNIQTNNTSYSSIDRELHEEVLIGLILFLATMPMGAIYNVIRYNKVKAEILANPNKYEGIILWNVLFGCSVSCLVAIAIYLGLFIAGLAKLNKRCCGAPLSGGKY